MTAWIEHLADILVTTMLAHSVERIMQFLARWDGSSQALDDLVVAGAVVDYDVAFGLVEEGFDEGDAATCNCDDGMDVCAREEFDCEGADGAGSAVDYDAAGGEGARGVDGGPGFGEAEACVLRLLARLDGIWI
jgi:hypothetical protein